MHEQLAKDLNLKSYRRMTCSAVAVDGGGKPLSKKLANVEWVDLGTKVIALMCIRGFDFTASKRIDSNIHVP